MSEKTEEQKAAEAKAAADKKAADEKAAAAKKTKVRVIIDHAEHRIDDVVALLPEDAAAAVAAGWADDHPAAVKYAESLTKAQAEA